MPRRDSVVHTVKEAAERLGISPALVYALCKAGKLVHERYGLGRGTIRISEKALETYQEQSRVEQPRPAPAQLKHIKMPSPASR